MDRIALYNDSFQNWKTHDIQKAQLILTDIPYQLGINAYGSNPMWYEGGVILMEKANMRKRAFLILTLKQVFALRNFFISVAIF